MPENEVHSSLMNYLGSEPEKKPPVAENQPAQDVENNEPESDEADTPAEEEGQDDLEENPENPDDQEAEGDQDGDEEEAEEDEADYLTIKHNGEEKTLSKTEVIELTQKGYDYDAKMQRLGEERRELTEETTRTREVHKEVEQKRNAYVEELMVVEAFNSHPLYTQQDLDKLLSEQGAETYLAAKGKEEQRQKILGVVKGAIKQHNELAIEEAKKELKAKQAEGQKVLQDKMPELLSKEGKARLVSYLVEEFGYTPEQIGAEPNPNHFIAYEESRKYREMQKKAKERKPAHPLPKFNKSSKGRPDKSQIQAQQRREQIGRAKQSGKIDDAALAILGLLK